MKTQTLARSRIRKRSVPQYVASLAALGLLAGKEK